MIPRRTLCQHTGGLQTVGQGSIGDNDGFQFREILFNAAQFNHDFGQLPSCEVHGNPADPVDPSEKAGSGQPVVQLHHLFFHAIAMRMGQGVRRIVTDRAHITEMVVEALQFQKQAPQIAAASWYIQTQQRFNRLTIGETMTDGRVSGHPFGQRNRCG